MATVTVHKLGPGQLTFGETGSPTEFGVRVSKATLTPEVEEGDERAVLSGDIVADDAELKWKLEGELYQDYSAQSLIKWCLDNNGKVLAFTFRARSDQPLTATGNAKIRPVAYGGEVKNRNTSEFEFVATEVAIDVVGG